MREPKGSEQARGALKVSQCFFALPTYAKSVTLAIATGATKEYWRKLQSPPAKEREGRESAKPAELQEELYRPQPVSGVGEQALWLRSRFGGSLYVLQGETLLIVSVGGRETEPSRIEKSKLLAARALRRLAM